MLKNYYADVSGSRIMMTFKRSLNVLTNINDVAVMVLGLEPRVEFWTFKFQFI